MPGGNFPSNHACQAARWMNQARNRTAGNTLLMCIASNLYIKMAALGRLFSCNTGIKVTSAPYCELYCHAVCTWKLWNLSLSWFVYERIRLILVNSRVLKITVTNEVCTWRCWTLPHLRFERERMQLVFEIILLNKILRNDLLFENLQWNYPSFNVTLIYLMHNQGLLHDIFFGSRQLRAKYCQTFGNKSNPVNSTDRQTDLPSNFLKIARPLGKIKHTLSLRFINLYFRAKNRPLGGHVLTSNE